MYYFHHGIYFSELLITSVSPFLLPFSPVESRLSFFRLHTRSSPARFPAALQKQEKDRELFVEAFAGAMEKVCFNRFEFWVVENNKFTINHKGPDSLFFRNLGYAKDFVV